MNKQRRKQITAIQDQLEELKANVEILMEEEQEYVDNIPENMQDSGNTERANEAVGNLENAIASIEEAIEYLQEAAQ